MNNTINRLLVLPAIMFAGLLLSNIAMSNDTFNAEAKYAQTCGVCHNSGVAGAPKKGDSKAWAARLAKGEAVLLKNVTQGIGAMPAKGLCNDCDQAQFSALIKYMSK